MSGTPRTQLQSRTEFQSVPSTPFVVATTTCKSRLSTSRHVMLPKFCFIVGPRHTKKSGKDGHASTSSTHDTIQRTRVVGYLHVCTHDHKDCKLLQIRVREGLRTALVHRRPPMLASLLLVIETDVQRTDKISSASLPAAATPRMPVEVHPQDEWQGRSALPRALDPRRAD